MKTQLNIPKSYQNLFKRAASGKSKSAALKAKCLECCGMQRVEVENCSVLLCPLRPYRPYQDAKGRKKTLVAGGLGKKNVNPVAEDGPDETAR
jgi:hypothetical protein